MKLIGTPLAGLFIIQPDVFKDSRGLFFESFSLPKFKDFGIDCDFVQDNQSNSQKGVLRGLHFQKPPYAQAKLVRVANGSVLDVAVDIRSDSPTFGKWYSCVLSHENNLMLFIPEGFAHGMFTLEDNTIFLYKCSNVYNKSSEGGIIWNDPDLNINWGIADPMLSDKDVLFPTLKQSKHYF
ncbi:MAG: dTDP-4-dehydrorhamnose 3,5-epimerase [Bacteroidota bacterium]